MNVVRHTRRLAPPARRLRRAGLTLYEVLLALAIFLGALAALSQLLTTGSRAAVQANLQTQAVILCESKLAEVVAGVEPLQQVSGAVIEEAPEWQWSLEFVEGDPHEDLVTVVVSVAHAGQAGAADASFSIRRFIRNPLLWQEAAENAAAEGGS